MGLIAKPETDSLQTNLALKVLFDSLHLKDFSNNDLTMSLYGEPFIRNGQSKFPEYFGAWYFNGASDGVYASSTTQFAFNAVDWCVETWVRVDQASGGHRCIASTIRNMGNSVAGGGALMAGIGGWGGSGDEANGVAATIPGGSGILFQGGAGSSPGDSRSLGGGGGGGGGGGYYGGGGGAGGGGYWGGSGGGGGGGSNFVDDVILTNITMKKGSENITLPSGDPSVGNIGNGFARITRLSDSTVIDFPFIGAEQIFTAPSDDTYFIETWGAQGGNATVNGITEGGRGGYCSGNIFLTEGTVLYIYVGGQNGYNGGGAGGSSGSEAGKVGGGATDVRMGGNAISNRIIVAGGGGGCGGVGSNGSGGTKTSGIGGAAGENGVSAGGPNGWALFIDETAKCFWAYIKYTDGTYDMIREMTNVPLATTEWNHVALVRAGTTISLYRNGVKTGEVTCGSKLIQTNATIYFYIGCYRDDEGPRVNGLMAPLKGYINDFRVTLNNARYTSNFTPPTAFGTIFTGEFAVKTVAYTDQPEYIRNWNIFKPFDKNSSKITYTSPFPNGYDIYSKVISDNVNGAGKFVLYRSSETVRPPVSQASNRINAIKSSGGAQEYAGVGRIYGMVTENTQGISCLLRLYDNTSGALVASTRSTESGLYEFKNLKMSTTYTLVAYNPSKNYNSIIRDLIKPERM